MFQIQSLNRIPCVLEDDARIPPDNKMSYNTKENCFSKYFFFHTFYIFYSNTVCFSSYLSLGPPLPELDIDDLLNEEKRQELIDVLDQRIKKKDELRQVLITQSMI